MDANLERDLLEVLREAYDYLRDNCNYREDYLDKLKKRVKTEGA